jgi:GTPase SAR1 family protein
LVDTPGHGKLRSVAFDYITDADKLSGVIFVVDAADLSGPGQDSQLRGGLQDAAHFLHDVLLRLQKAVSQQQANKKRQPRELPVLVAANKLDLFTALPTPLVKSRLEAEISKVRDSRRRALFDSSVGTGMEGPAEEDEEREMLGDPLEEKFLFSQMAELGVPVQVLGGHAAGPDGGDVKAWWKWIAERM